MPTPAAVGARAHAPTTAKELLALVRSLGPAAEGEELVFAADPPPELEPALSVLHTGVRALLIGRRWCGSTTANGNRPRVVVLDPTAPIPVDIGLLIVEGDRRWDRISLGARIDLPGLFMDEKRPPRTRERT